MAKSNVLECQKREVSSKGNLNKLRRQGLIPGVVYGRDISPVAVSVNYNDIFKIFRDRGTGGLYRLNLQGGDSVMALVRDVQKTPVTKEIIHIDFMKVVMGEVLTSLVPVIVTGEEDLIKQKAIIQIGLKEVDIECLPGDLPDSLTLDISDREIGDKVTVGELELPEGVRVLTDPETMVLVISYADKTVEEETPEDGEVVEKTETEG
ncbi:MAG: 50S ribosomal protein L25 [Syntrophomonadaceae bacterium]|nr:50S ribosomal protein L25 [Syntrophomonadaceae bacterium]